MARSESNSPLSPQSPDDRIASSNVTLRSTRRGGLAVRGSRWLADRLQRQSAKAARAAFRHAAARVPAYADLLVTRGVNPTDVRRHDDFLNSVPITDKLSLFASYPLAQLCGDGRLNDAATLYTSSGFSGVFSFGAEARGDEIKLQKRIDNLLNHHIHINRLKTLVVNCLSSGVRVPSAKTAVIDTGTRPEAVMGAVRQIGPAFDQILLIGEHPFLKNVLELGIEADYDWSTQTTHLVTGGEWIPEGFRRYAARILGHRDPNDHSHPSEREDRAIPSETDEGTHDSVSADLSYDLANVDGVIRVSVGVSELNLSLGQETTESRRIHGLLGKDPAFRTALLGDSPFLPALVHYHPLDLFIETPTGEAGYPELVVTTLDRKRKIPLIRYTTGDRAVVISHHKLRQALEAVNRPDLIPRLPLPLLAMWGRAKGIEVEGVTVYPEQVKECLYAPGVMTDRLTGQFHLSAADGRLRVDLQMKQVKAQEASTAVFESVAASLAEEIQRQTGVSCIATPYAFFDYPRGMGVDYQSKFRYL
ncbi:MAG: phenylacetate--CoA ligase family protein [Planctomycetota bacterium]|jgi:phenylacetate-CoA ligase